MKLDTFKDYKRNLFLFSSPEPLQISSYGLQKNPYNR